MPSMSTRGCSKRSRIRWCESCRLMVLQGIEDETGDATITIDVVRPSSTARIDSRNGRITNRPCHRVTIGSRHAGFVQSCTHAYTHTHICACMHAFIPTCTHNCTHSHVYAHSHMCTQAATQLHAYIRVHASAHTHLVTV